METDYMEEMALEKYCGYAMKILETRLMINGFLPIYERGKGWNEVVESAFWGV